MSAEEALLQAANRFDSVEWDLKCAVWEAREASVSWNRIAELARVSRSTAQNWYAEVGGSAGRPVRVLLDAHRVPPELLERLQPYLSGG